MRITAENISKFSINLSFELPSARKETRRSLIVPYERYLFLLFPLTNGNGKRKQKLYTEKTAHFV